MIKFLLVVLAFVSFTAKAQTDEEFLAAWKDKACSGEFMCPLRGVWEKRGQIGLSPKIRPGQSYIINNADIVAVMRQMTDNINEETASHGGDVVVGRLEGIKRNLGYLEYVCGGLGAACSAAAGAAVATSGPWGLLGIGACVGLAGACAYTVDNMQDDLQKQIDAIKNACAQGDDACYEEIIGRFSRAPSGNSTSTGGSGATDGQVNSSIGPASATPVSTRTVTVIVGGQTRCTKDTGGHLTCRTQF